MSTEVELQKDRCLFEQFAVQYWEAIYKSDSASANVATENGNAIVARWAELGRADDLLASLLNSSSPEVRFAAGAHLLMLGFQSLALPVLKEIEESSTGFLAPAARLTMMRWTRKIDESKKGVRLDHP